MNQRLPNRIVRLIAIASALFGLAACGGGSDDDSPPPSGDTVTISGRITFDRVPFSSSLGGGLDMSNPIESPARGVIVEVIDANTSAILASTSTNASGEYSLQAPANRSVRVRAKAQMQKTGAAPTWNFRVLNNTNGDALYVLDSGSFSSGTTNVTRNLHAASGWNGTTYVNNQRSAAPFAILDTVYQAKELVLSADANVAFANLDLFWSPSNRGTVNAFCPDNGDIGTTFYQGAGTEDRCSPRNELPAGIYILGDYANGGGDTDEFDQHIIAHEFGHYFEDRFSRSDSIGGSHSDTDRLDLRVAFGEGWGNAFSGMVLEDPVYRDSQLGTREDFGFDMEADSAAVEGWFSETSISEILWDLYDDAADPNDNVSLGFGPIYETMTGPQIQTEALTSIFSFADALKRANPAQAAAINALLSNEGIVAIDAFGTGETNNGSVQGVLPIYEDLIENQPLLRCVTGVAAGAADNNKLGNRRLFRLANDRSRLVTINVIASAGSPGTQAATDVDVFVYRRGAIVAGAVLGKPNETLPQITLEPGTHIIEVYDFDLEANPSTTRCMTVSITGN
jgi:hypothetical protein